MLNIPCRQAISCCDEFPLQNWTSEDPDVHRFVGQNWGWGNEKPRTGHNWTHSWCYGLCISTVSQEEADLCAAAHEYLCLNDPPGDPRTGDGGGGEPTVPDKPPTDPAPGPGQPENKVYANSPYTARFTCPDGTEVTYDVAGGIFLNSSPSQANAMAKSYGDYQLARKIVCLGDLFDWACAGDYIDETLTLPFLNNPPATFVVRTGSLPPGYSLVPNAGGSSASFFGVCDTPGYYNFSILVINAAGVTNEKSYSMDIFGISNLGSIPAAKCDQPYSYQLTDSGGHGAVTYSLTPGFSLPAGLTLSAGGLISGTPTVDPVSQLVSITVTDSSVDDAGNPDPRVCSKEFTFTVQGPRITCPGVTGPCCAFYNQNFGVTPAGSVFAPVSLPSGGLTLTPAGNLSGTPTAFGPVIVQATDPEGNVNQKTCNLITAGTNTTAAKNLLWTYTTLGSSPGFEGTGSMLPSPGANIGFFSCTGAVGKQSEINIFSAQDFLNPLQGLAACCFPGCGWDLNIEVGWSAAAAPGTLVDVYIGIGLTTHSFAGMALGTGGLVSWAGGIGQGANPSIGPHTIEIHCVVRAGPGTANFQVTITPADRT